MTRNAPHLVHAMPQLVPLLPSMSHTKRALVRAGFLAGDALRMLAGTPASTLPRSRRVSARRVVEMAPTVRRDGLDGGFLAYDGQLIDDARLVTAVARTAAQHGARILTYVAASEATGTSVRLTDQRTGQSFDVSAGAVINAAGVWAGEIDGSLRLRPSRGTHLVFDCRDLRQSDCGADHSDSRRAQPLRVRHARATGPGLPRADRRRRSRPDSRCAGTVRGEIAFLLDTVNTALGTALGTADVIGAYAGLRPLIDTGEGRTADVSREHAVFESPSGVISVIGGKLTEYRYMAEDVVDSRHRPATPARRRLPDPQPAADRSAGQSRPGLPAGRRVARVAGAAVRRRGVQRHRHRYVRAADRARRRGHRRDPGGVRVRGDP